MISTSTIRGGIWRSMWETHMAEAERARGGPESEEQWRGLRDIFRQDPRRTGDPQVERLARELAPDKTLLDVGAGAGRLALPLALRCRHVTAIEPSPAMVEGFLSSAAEAGITNISVVQSSWEDADVPASDVVLCADVVYFVRDIVEFVRRLERHARERVLVMASLEWTPHYTDPLWERVHGGKRARRPALPELLPVLWEMGIYPDLEMLPPIEHRPWANWEEARQMLQRMLFVTPNSPQDRRLENAMRELLEETDGQFRLRGANPRRVALASWRVNR